MTTLDTVRSFLTQENGLAAVSTVQTNGAVLSSVVNCGLIDHPVTREPRVAFVSMGNAARLRHIRRGSPITVAIRRTWKWVSITGTADLIGPNDNAHGFEPDRIRLLLRDVFLAAQGQHDDWDDYDRTMLADERTAVLIAPQRLRGDT